MKTYKLAQLNLAFTLLVILIGAVLAILIWQRQDAIEQLLREGEQKTAREEIQEAMRSLDKETARISRDISEWEETHQQLVYPGYYLVWHDIRLKDAGHLAASIDGVALYDKQGRILMPDDSPDPMPIAIATSDINRPIFFQQDGHAHTLVITPIHADPISKILLGYLAIKTDIFAALQEHQNFRFVDTSSLKAEGTHLQATDYESLARNIRYSLRPNPHIDMFRDVFKSTLLQLFGFLVIVLTGTALLIHRTIVHPLLKLTRDIDAIRHHAAPEANKPGVFPIREVENLRSAFQNHHGRLMELHADLERDAQEFQHQAVHDALTGVYNRRAFDSDRQLTGRYALLLFDCDGFKAINDNYGHAVGDAVLKTITACLQQALRAEDRLYRLGGDEFAALLQEADRAAAHAIAKRCRQHVQSQDFRPLGLPEPVSVSIGIALNDGSDTDLEAMQRQADAAMYAAKQAGTDKIAFYDDLSSRQT